MELLLPESWKLSWLLAAGVIAVDDREEGDERKERERRRQARAGGER